VLSTVISRLLLYPDNQAIYLNAIIIKSIVHNIIMGMHQMNSLWILS